MQTADYDAVVAAIAAAPTLDCGALLLREFPSLEAAQLNAILSQEVQKYTKHVSHVFVQQRKTEELYSKYLARTEAGSGGALLQLARQHRFPPAMMAKLLLSHHLCLHPPGEEDRPDSRGASPLPTPASPTAAPSSPPPAPGDARRPSDASVESALKEEGAEAAEQSLDDSGATEAQNTAETLKEASLAPQTSSELPNASQSHNTPQRLKQQVKKMLRDTSLIPDKTLSHEVHLCLVADPHYGPYSDAVKHSIGHEYEALLVRRLTALGAAFRTEDHLRKQGCDKTPDVKLDVPIGVGGRVVNWIESKAMFGDRRNHRKYLSDQLWSYWNRFGPGLVIYWFGFAADLDTTADRGILLRDGFPEDVELYDPAAVEGEG